MGPLLMKLNKCNENLVDFSGHYMSLTANRQKTADQFKFQMLVQNLKTVDRDIYIGHCASDAFAPESEKRKWPQKSIVGPLQELSVALNLSLGVVAFNEPSETTARMHNLHGDVTKRERAEGSKIIAGTPKPITYIQLDGRKIGINLRTLDILTSKEITAIAGVRPWRLFWFLAS